MANPAGARQYGDFITLADAKSWLQIPNTDTTHDSSLQLTIDMACTWVQNYIGRPASSQEFRERHDGWSGEYIMLKESPIIELVSCTEWQSSGGSISLPESTPENPIDGIQLDYSTGRIMRTFAGYSWPRPFFPGSRNIEIVYLAGYNPTPPDIVVATLEFIAHWWRNTQQASREVLRPRDYDPAGPSGLWTGVPFRIIDLLEPYMKVGIA